MGVLIMKAPFLLALLPLLSVFGCIDIDGTEGLAQAVGDFRESEWPEIKKGANVVNISIDQDGGWIAHRWDLPQDWKKWTLSAKLDVHAHPDDAQRWVVYQGVDAVVSDQNGERIVRESLRKSNFGPAPSATSFSVDIPSTAVGIVFFFMSSAATDAQMTIQMGEAKNVTFTSPSSGEREVFPYKGKPPLPVPSVATVAEESLHSPHAGFELFLIGYQTYAVTDKWWSHFRFTSTSGKEDQALVLVPGVSFPPGVNASTTPSSSSFERLSFFHDCSPPGQASWSMTTTHAPGMARAYYIRGDVCPSSVLLSETI